MALAWQQMAAGGAGKAEMKTRGGPGAGAAGLHLHSAGCAALPAADRPGLARVLRGARLAAERWLGYGIELDNAVIDAGRPATFGFHLCRGNQLSRWLVSGGYDAIAAPVFGEVHADRLLLEYDDERSGTFDPLRLVPERQGRGAGPGHHEDIAGRAAGPDQGPARPGTLAWSVLTGSR